MSFVGPQGTSRLPNRREWSMFSSTGCGRQSRHRSYHSLSREIGSRIQIAIARQIGIKETAAVLDVPATHGRRSPTSTCVLWRLAASCQVTKEASPWKEEEQRQE